METAASKMHTETEAGKVIVGHPSRPRIDCKGY
jgi:hypothetical protein